MRRLTFFSIAVMLCGIPGVTRADSVIEEIIARVNNSIVTRSEYLRERDQVKQEAQQQNPTNADKAYAEREKDILRGLIDQQLLEQKGEDLGISADTDVIKRLDEMRKQMKLDSMEDLQKAAEAQGVSFEDFKHNMKTQIITQKVIGSEVGQKLSVSKEEEEKFYQDHKSEMERPEAVRLSELLVSTEKADAEQVAAAKVKADDLLAKIRAGGSFEELTKANSNGPSAAQAGDLGYFERGKLAKELEDKTFAMKTGEVSDVIQTKQGFVILKVTDHEMPGVPPFDEAKSRIEEAIYMQKLQPALRTYLTKLREDAFIYIKPGYIDTGASPNQTAPIETAAKDANAKKLKKKKKLGVF